MNLNELMKKYVCLRDDDTNYHTRPEELTDAYGEFWGKIPVTLATVPFSHGSQNKILEYEDDVANRNNLVREWTKNASADELSDYHQTWPIGLNKELVSFLKPLVANGMIEIAQHGVHHAYNERGPEMFSNETGFEAIRDGKEYLEKVFDTEIVTFIPPSNTIDVTCVGYLNRLGMHLFSSGIIMKNNVHEPTRDINAYFRAAKRVLLRQERKPLVKNFGIMQFQSHTFGIYSDENSFYEKLKKDLDTMGFTGLGSHYLIFDKPYRERYRKLISRLKDELDVEFVTAKEYYRLMVEKFYA